MDADWSEILEAVESFRLYTDDWDFDGGIAPDTGVIDLARCILEDHRKVDFGDPPSRVTATPTGTILISWDGSPRLEFEVVSPRRIEWTYVDGSGESRHGILERHGHDRIFDDGR